MKRSRSAVLRFFFILFQLLKHLGGYLLYAGLTRLGVVRRNQTGGVWSELPRPTRIRLFLQEVDGALIKLGQILAMRVDFLPDEYVRELLKLLDEVPPFDPALARSIIESELNARIEDLFGSFENEPLAAASFGQVHAATLAGGEQVVIKVRRPGVEATIEADLKLFRVFASLADATGLTRRMPLKEVYADFASWTREELDYRVEGSHVQELFDKAAGSKTERFPKVHWSLTTQKVLTLERLYGIWVKEIIERLQADERAVVEQLASINTRLLDISQNILRNTLRQIFVYGIYHADPHAANLLVMNDGVIGYVDLGITGRIGDESKEIQVDLHIALESGDFDKFFLTLLETLGPPQGANLSAFRHAAERAYTDWLNSQYMGHSNTREKSFARLMLRINNAAQKYGFAFGRVELRIFRALVTVDAVLLQFAPTMDVRSELRHFFGAYRAFNLASDKLPALAHKLPVLVNMLSNSLERTVVRQIARVSKVRASLGVILQVISVVLFVLALFSIFVPGIISPIRRMLQSGQLASVSLLFLGSLIFAWLGFVLRLRSVIYDTVVEHRRNPICADPEK
jgi:ubiquinone biosynthesis protein